MTPLGDYTPNITQNGVTAINPTKFIETNWSLMCRIIQIPKPKLNIVKEDPNDDYFFGISTALVGRHHEVWLCIEQLETGAVNFCKGKNDLVAGLWGACAIILRHILIDEGIVPNDQYIVPRVARKGGLDKESTDTIRKDIDSGPHTLDFKVEFDTWTIFHVVYDYICRFHINEHIDPERVRDLVRVERDLVKERFFL
jgi:hypothetical protein